MDAEQRYAGGLFQTTLTGVLSVMSWIAYGRILTRLIVLCHKTQLCSELIFVAETFFGDSAVLLLDVMYCDVCVMCVSGQSVSGDRLLWVYDGSHGENIHSNTESTCHLQKLAADRRLLQTDGNSNK